MMKVTEVKPPKSAKKKPTIVTYAFYVSMKCAEDDSKPGAKRTVIDQTLVPLAAGQAATDPTPPSIATVYAVLLAEANKL
jgi:hypothetical protein